MCALNSSSYVCLPAIAGMRAERRNAEAMEERERTWAEEREGAWAHRVGQAGPMALIPQKGHGKQASEEARMISQVPTSGHDCLVRRLVTAAVPAVAGFPTAFAVCFVGPRQRLRNQAIPP
eukprot:Tamp_31561.p2 GENE.Tamp_31561~~Tamp_31561.p2  ORF type:complete len:121 (+),score=13.70 Tamp_31561:109-471(+)